MKRRVRVTLRCLDEDLEIPLPDPQIDLADVDHPLVEECRRLADLAPRGQKRILSIDFPMVYRVAHGQRLRGATWVDKENNLFWLLAVEWHEEGSLDDAYLYFESLHKNDRLLPTRDDYLRDRVEAGGRAIAAVKIELPGMLAAARANPGRDFVGLLIGKIEVLFHIQRDDDLEAIWMAVSAFDSEKNEINPRFRDIVFVAAEQLLEGAEWESVTEWPSDRPIQWFEIARIALRETS